MHNLRYHLKFRYKLVLTDLRNKHTLSADARTKQESGFTRNLSKASKTMIYFTLEKTYTKLC